MSVGPVMKGRVRAWWGEEPCGTRAAKHARGTRAYFEDIEADRYRREPEIHAFAQFTRYRGRRVLEVGVGAGTDFIQWTRAGADAWGVDLTPEAIQLVRERLAEYDLDGTVQVADAEALPFADDEFDLVYSFGVIHHTPDTYKALGELIRVTKPGGEIKVMVYNRHSVAALFIWMRKALQRGVPWHGLKWAIAQLESPGTKAYTRREVETWAESFQMREVHVSSWRTYYDYQRGHHRIFQVLAKPLAALGGDRFGFFLGLRAVKA